LPNQARMRRRNVFSARGVNCDFMRAVLSHES
jgi:hypothetical protein